MHWNNTRATLPLPNQSQITSLLIEDCPHLTSLAEGFLQQHVHLESLHISMRKP